MTLAEKEMLDVMAYADGELEADEAARVEGMVTASVEARELLASIRALGEGVRAAAPTGSAASLEITDEIMGRLVPNELDRARLKRHGRVRMAFVAASVAAIAAAVFLYVRQGAETPQQATNQGPAVPVATAPLTTAPVPTPDPSGALAQLRSRSVEVDSVDTGSHAVSVFYVDNAPAADTPAQSVVVWIDDSNGAQ